MLMFGNGGTIENALLVQYLTDGCWKVENAVTRLVDVTRSAIRRDRTANVGTTAFGKSSDSIVVDIL